jgi:Transglutaminase-like domain
MYEKSGTLLILCLLVSIIASSQPAARFYSVDSFAKTVRYKGNLDSLTKRLTAPYAGQLFKTRAIFRWITENIRYDYKDYNRYDYKGKDRKGYKCRDDEDCEAKKIAWETKYIDRVVRRKKGVCAGYAMLFKKMCDLAGLKSEMIEGYTRQLYYQVGSTGSLNHAWNSVWIDSAYYLLDATWAAGGCEKDDDGKLLFFQKNFNEYYWLTPPDDFVRDHYPKTPTWTLIPNYTKEKFAANPYYKPSELANIELITPKSGIINAKKGDTIHFKIDYEGSFDNLQINSDIFRNPDIWVVDKISRRKTVRRLDTIAVKMQQYIPYRRDGSFCEFEYVVTSESLYYLDILFDRQRIMRFNVHVNK